MKKYSKIITTLLALPFFFISCEKDVLNQDLRHTLSAEDAANTVKGNQALLAGSLIYAREVYNDFELRIPVFKQCGVDIVQAGTNLADEPATAMPAMNGYTSDLASISAEIQTFWDNYYQGITPANQIINSITSSGNIDDLSEDIKNSLGQAYTMRAFLYLELVRRFENIPIVKVANLDETGPVSETQQSSPSEVYDLIISDLEAAIPLLKKRVELDNSVLTISSGLANMLLAEASLDVGDYVTAAAAADAVIADESYSLQPLDGIFGLDGGKGGEENNAEIIFSIGFEPPATDNVQWTSQHFVPLYDRVAGVARTMDQGGRPWSRLSPSEYYWSLFDSDDDGDVEDEADGRIQAWHKLYWTFDDAENLPAGKEVGDRVTLEDVQAQWPDTPNNWRYIEPTTIKTWENGEYGRTTALAEGWRNIIIFRYAQAYISGAEAYFKQGNTAKALQYLNVLRERAYGNASGNFGSITFEDIVEEQARELGHEGHRWYFLKRNNLLVERVGMYNPSATGNIQDKHVRWPIPQGFIDQTGATQNPGY
ncbi:RagB/SusD family nutrient uptake outer membrane protein [Flagellimonas pelagia]|uniref:RagB/SusD family nutrient uptake outer membrane protein n=1 Tax=Flagellimonas pelagia TaxID=2306998 RepID=A0A3A1NR62_9FLAO|nr:RagB/SusD family nutrient uptake outer membrane protein [Allomuricauda maritima]RIV46424.1 RagB/SusD family nutrient uptake outer membrane protein [Allomuricauda maritima]TXJ99085.1 RagB/SusD family nutrient uptake outer membrane protein [Allomuricauda maritima]